MNLHIERRKRFRKKPPRLVYVELGNGNGGMMRDLSEDGFALRAMMPLATGEKMHFCLSLEDSMRIEGEGQVIWTGEGGRAAGLKFVEITPEARAQIRDWLAGLDAISKEEINEEPREPTKESRPVPSASELVERLRREARSVPPRPVSIKESSVSVATPETEQEPPPPSRPAERTTQHASIASQMLPSAPVVPSPPAPVHEEPPAAAPVARSPAAPTYHVPQAQQPVWQRQPPVLVPLPSLEDETEGGELAAARRVRRSVFSRTFGFILLLALGAAGWFYHEEVGYGLIWIGQQLTGVDQVSSQQAKTDAATPAAAAPSQPAPAATPEAAKPKSQEKIPNDAQEKKQDPPADTAEHAAHEQPASTPAGDPDPVTPPTTSKNNPAPADPAPEAGQSEYADAMRILGGDQVRTRMPEAVRLLWVAVEKGNSNAEVTLAGLYRDGRGVKKNCEQARVLLSAAARKGNTLAKTSLQQFLRGGCE
jgi:hypothetical protein